jgi:aminoglycoside 6'-N-acetyltransferase I
MNVRKATYDDLDVWVRLRHDLWPDHALEALTSEARAMLGSENEVCFIATDGACQALGFLEGAVHQGANGPYGHVEGWYVKPEFRQQGYGKEFMGQFEQWCLHRSICMFTSDTESSYPLRPAAHSGGGFRQIHELKIFMKKLQPQGPG